MKCDFCGKTPEEREQLLNKKRAEHGWVIEFAINDHLAPNIFNCHTHFLPSYIGHPDLQICLPMSPHACADLFHMIVGMVKEGNTFLPNVKYPGLLEGGYDLMFIEAKESGRNVMRMVLPNPKTNTFEGGDYAAQFTLVENHI